MSKEKELNVSEALGFTDDLMFQIVMRDPEICRMFLNEVWTFKISLFARKKGLLLTKKIKFRFLMS